MDIKYFEAADNKMFPPEITMFIRFIQSKKAIICPLCGKKRKKLWTMLVPFRGQTFNQFTMTKSNKLEALTPVCDDHPITPVFIELMEKTADQSLDSGDKVVNEGGELSNANSKTTS